MNPKFADELREKDVYYFLLRELKSAISEEYLNDICHAIRDDVLWEVKATENGAWSDDDIKLAVGRVLMKRLGLKL